MDCVSNTVVENESDTHSMKDTTLEEKSQELDSASRIVTEIIRQNKTTCWPFMNEVDIKGLGLWDYKARIKAPMWLNKITEKLDKGEYSGITDFARDFRTMVENCYRYNGTEHAISKKAKRLEMAFEGKLALLKKEIRDKASLSLTSNGKFSITMSDDSLAPVSRYGRIGNTREYASVMNDSTAKLVYDFVKCEETMLLEDEKKASHRERRMQEQLYQRIAAAWITSLENSDDAKLIKTSHALAEIGFFLHLCESVLKFPELNMYLLERSVLVPENSLYLSKIMTSLLCSYQERSQINQRPPMHFSTWNKRLKERLTKWFETVQKHGSYIIAAERIGIHLEFFQALEWKNPFFSNEKDINFSEVSFNARVHIIKALCDSLFLLQSVQNAMQAMDGVQLQHLQLGKDFLGNIYIYFPQFCGDDVRVYRHREFGEPIQKTEPDSIWVPEIPPDTDAIDSKEEILQNWTESTSSDDKARVISVDSKNAIGSFDIREIENQCVTEKFAEASNNTTSTESEKSVVLENSEDIHLSKSSSTFGDQTSADVKENGISDNENGELIEKDPKESHDQNTKVVTEPVIENGIPDLIKESSEATNNLDCDSDNKDIKTSKKMDEVSFCSHPSLNGEVMVENAEKVSDSECTPRKRTRKRNTVHNNDVIQTPGRRSLRKRNTPIVLKVEPEHKVLKKKKKIEKASPKKPKKEPIVKYGTVEFEMLCDSVDGIQLLINELESQQTDSNKSLYTKIAFTIHRELIERLRWLYDELEPWNVKLQKAKLSAQIQMKRESDEIQNKSRKFDPWSEELSSKNTYMFGDNVTVSHMAVDSPMSSINSYDGDTGDEEYSHSYYTRKTVVSPPPRIFDESLYEIERETLLSAALIELEEVLNENLNELMKFADRAQLLDNTAANDSRRTRHKIKQQNKVLGKVLTFAEDNVFDHPSLLPILVPNSDVFDVVDVILLKEETRLQEIAEEQRRKRLQKAMKPNLRHKKQSSDGNVRIMNKKCPNLTQPISIRMQNGQVFPATRLDDGRVVPIVRQRNAPKALSVEELISNTHKEVKRANNIPHISLRVKNSPETTQKRANILSTEKVTPTKSKISCPSSVTNSPVQQTPLQNTKPVTEAPSHHNTIQGSKFSPKSSANVSLNLGSVTVKHKPRRIVITQPLRRSLPHVISKTSTTENQSRLVVSGSTSNTVVTPQINIQQGSTKATLLNVAQYGIVNVPQSYSIAPTLAYSQQQNILDPGKPQTFFISQPTTPGHAVLTPVQIIDPSISYQSNNNASSTGKQSNVVLVPVQNCTTAGIAPGPVQIGAAPVLGVITSPHRQLQFQPNQSK